MQPRHTHTGGPEQGHAWGPLVLWQATLSAFGFFYQISQHFRSQWLDLKSECEATDSNYFILSRSTEVLEFLFLPFMVGNRHSENHIGEPGPSPPRTPRETARGRRPAPKPLPLPHIHSLSRGQANSSSRKSVPPSAGCVLRKPEPT